MKRKKQKILLSEREIYEFALFISVFSLVFVLTIADASITGFAAHESISGNAGRDYDLLKEQRFDELLASSQIVDFDKNVDIISKKTRINPNDVVKMGIIDSKADTLENKPEQIEALLISPSTQQIILFTENSNNTGLFFADINFVNSVTDQNEHSFYLKQGELFLLIYESKGVYYKKLFNKRKEVVKKEVKESSNECSQRNENLNLTAKTGLELVVYSSCKEVKEKGLEFLYEKAKQKARGACSLVQCKKLGCKCQRSLGFNNSDVTKLNCIETADGVKVEYSDEGICVCRCQ